MIYAPVIITTLNRFEHFKVCIESLKKNGWAKYTELFIGLDYPIMESHWEGYNKINDYINIGIVGFKKVNVFKRTKNYGAFGNMEALYKEVFKKFDRYIYTEDDNVFSTNFIEYIDKGLELFEEDDDCQAICGYSYPIQWFNNGNNVVKVPNFFSAWGYGGWRDKFIDWNATINSRFIRDIAKNSRISLKILFQSRIGFCKLIGFISNDKVAAWDSPISLYLASSNKYCIMPLISKVRNEGFDNSGVNCTIKEFGYDIKDLDNNQHFDYFKIKNLEINSLNVKKLDKFHHIKSIVVYKSLIKWILYKLIGYQNYKKYVLKHR